MRAILCTLFAALAAYAPAASEAVKPNVVFILVDDLRWDALGATGHPFMKTPNIDRIAHEGANFQNAFVTTPLCSPARASFLTGQYVHSHGILRNHTDDSGHRLENFARQLQPAGYENGYVGKWHMGNDASPRPGFDYWAGLQGQSTHFNPPVNVNGAMIREKGYTADVLTSYAVAFIREKREKPFTLYVSHKAVHGPFKPAPRHKDLYSTEPLKSPPSVEDSLEGKPALQREVSRGGVDQKQGRNEETVRNQLRLLQAVDESVGGILAALEETKQLDDTLVVFTSDNGYQWGEHRLGDKRTAYEESIRIPLLMRYPKLIPAGSRPDAMALNVDIAPTFLDLAGKSVPAGMHGRSLLSLVREGGTPPRPSALFEYFSEARYPHIPSWQAVRTADGWKYIRYEFEGMDELYSLGADPYEMKNLVKEASAQAKLAELKEALKADLARTDGKLLDQRKWTPASEAKETTNKKGSKAGKPGKKKAGAAKQGQRRPSGPPNVVLIFADDLGYGDIGSFGKPPYATPHLDRMASEGVRLTQFYIPSPSCTPSRAALLTGRYPERVGLPRVLNPNDKIGMPASEITLAEALKKQGYATAAVGKWHLGHLPEFLPTRHGFDEYFGIPYSNDMFATKRNYPPVPLMRGTEVIEQPADQATLTRRYTEEAAGFIRRNADKPFFLYLPHTFPHIPLAASDRFLGKSGAGLYGDVIQELDWSVGEVLKTLREQRIDRNTLVIFTSDNGPWLIKKDHAGTAGDLRDGKGTCYEGGVRVPFLARWPTKLPSGTTVEEPVISTDLFPTLVGLAGGKLPKGRKLDGVDVFPVLMGRGSRKGEDLLYFRNGTLVAIRSGKWKLHRANTNGTTKPLELYDMDADHRESRNVAAEHPEIAERLFEKAEKAQKEIAPKPVNKRRRDGQGQGRKVQNVGT